MLALVTGFGPFLDVDVNPSGLIAASLDGQSLVLPDTIGAPPLRIVAATLPVAYDAAAQHLRALATQLAPDIVILLGVARSPDYRLESGASPRITSPHPDATGQASEGRILGELRLTTTRPVAALAERLRDHGFDTRVSDDCGGYVCNSTYYAGLSLWPHALFIHIPPPTDAGALATGKALVEGLLRLLASQPAETSGDLRRPPMTTPPPTIPLDLDNTAEPRYRLHLLALRGGDADLQPGYRRIEEKLRKRLPAPPPEWVTIDDALVADTAPAIDRPWFDQRNAGESLQLQKSLDALAASPFARIPSAEPVRIIAATAVRPVPALAPRARTVVIGLETPPSLAWLAALALPHRAAIAAALPDLPPDAARFAAMMLAGQDHHGALTTSDLDTLLTDIVSTLVPPQHRGDETIAVLSACRAAGLLPEHPGEYERMLHGIPRRRSDRIHRAWLRRSFVGPSAAPPAI